jgi:hypothetical protein
MDTAAGYKRHDPLRVCDICGVVFHKSKLRRIGPLKWACPDDAKGLTAEQIDRHNAKARPLIVRPVKHAKGPSETSVYQVHEADIFNLLTGYEPTTLTCRGNPLSTDGLDQRWRAGVSTNGIAPFHAFEEAAPYAFLLDVIFNNWSRTL